MQVKRSVGIQGVFSERQTLSIWNVFIPSEVTVEDYVANCKRTNTVSLINTNGNVVHRVPIDVVAIQYIKFPLNQNTLGSPVLAGNLLYGNQLVVISVFDFDNDYTEYLQNEKALSDKTDTGTADVRVQGKDGVIMVSANADKANGGKLIVNISNLENLAEVIVNVNGSVSISATGTINARSDVGIISEVKEGVDDLNFNRASLNRSSSVYEIGSIDEEGNENMSYRQKKDGFSLTEEFFEDGEPVSIHSRSADNTTLSPKTELFIGDGAEPMVLGNTLAELLKNLIVEIAKSQTNAGPLLNAALISEFISSVDNILSKYSKTQ